MLCRILCSDLREGKHCLVMGRGCETYCSVYRFLMAPHCGFENNCDVLLILVSVFNNPAHCNFFQKSVVYVILLHLLLAETTFLDFQQTANEQL